MAITEDAMYTAAATLAAAIIREDCHIDPSLRLGTELIDHSATIHFLVLNKLRERSDGDADIDATTGRVSRFLLPPSID